MVEPFVPEVRKALIDYFIVERATGAPVTPTDLTAELARKGQGVSENYVLDRLETLTSKGVLARGMGSYHAVDRARTDLDQLRPFLDLVSERSPGRR